jgi:hypothetical protein
VKLFADAALASVQEARIVSLEAEKVALQADLRRALARIDELTDKLVNMKQVGFEVAPPPLPTPPPPRAFHPLIEQALTEVGEGEDARDLVAVWLDGGLEVKRVVEMIYRGGSVPLV